MCCNGFENGTLPKRNSFCCSFRYFAQRKEPDPQLLRQRANQSLDLLCKKPGNQPFKSIGGGRPKIAECNPRVDPIERRSGRQFIAQFSRRPAANVNGIRKAGCHVSVWRSGQQV